MKRGGRVTGGRHRRGFHGGPWLVPTYYVAPCDPLYDPWCYHPIGGEPRFSGDIGNIPFLNALVAEDPLWVQLDDAFTHLIFDTPSRFNPTNTLGTFDPSLSQLSHKFVDDYVAWRLFFNGYLKAGPEWFGLGSQESNVAQLNHWKERRVAWAKDFEAVTGTKLPSATRLEQTVKPPSGSVLQPYLIGGGIAAGIVLLLSLTSRR